MDSSVPQQSNSRPISYKEKPYVAVILGERWEAPICARCFVEKPSMPRCKGCSRVHYCQQSCQVADWAQHKYECVMLKKAKNKQLYQGIIGHFSTRLLVRLFSQRIKDKGVASDDCLEGFPVGVSRQTLDDLLKTAAVPESDPIAKCCCLEFEQYAPKELQNSVSKAEVMALGYILVALGHCLFPLSDYLHSDDHGDRAWDGDPIGWGVFLQFNRFRTVCCLEPDLETYWNGSQLVVRLAPKRHGQSLAGLLEHSNKGESSMTVCFVENSQQMIRTPSSLQKSTGSPAILSSFNSCCCKICTDDAEQGIREISVCQNCTKCGAPVTAFSTGECLKCNTNYKIPRDQIAGIKKAVLTVNTVSST